MWRITFSSVSVCHCDNYCFNFQGRSQDIISRKLYRMCNFLTMSVKSCVHNRIRVSPQSFANVKNVCKVSVKEESEMGETNRNEDLQFHLKFTHKKSETFFNFSWNHNMVTRPFPFCWQKKYFFQQRKKILLRFLLLTSTFWFYSGKY